MSKSGKIGYALTYNAVFLLIFPVLRLFAGTNDMQDLLLLLVASTMLAAGIALLNRSRKHKEQGSRVWGEPLVLWRDRLARGLLAGSMIWLNIYLVSSNYTFSNSRLNPQAWAFFNLLALIVFMVAWILFLTSPSDQPHVDRGGA